MQLPQLALFCHCSFIHTLSKTNNCKDRRIDKIQITRSDPFTDHYIHLGIPQHAITPPYTPMIIKESKSSIIDHQTIRRTCNLELGPLTLVFGRVFESAKWELQGAGNRRLGVKRICFASTVAGVWQIALELWRWYSQKPALRSYELTVGGSFIYSPPPGGLEKCRVRTLALPPITPNAYSDPILLRIATPEPRHRSGKHY